MKMDWREVLSGVTVADLERHPARYRKEPYRTALREAQEEFTKGWAASQQAFQRASQRQFEAIHAEMARAFRPPTLPEVELPPEYQKHRDLFKLWANDPELRELSLPASLEALRTYGSFKATRAGREGHREAMPKLQANKAQREKEIIDAAQKVLREHPRLPPKNLTAKVVEKTGYSAPKVRTVLQAEDYVAKKNKNTPS